MRIGQKAHVKNEVGINRYPVAIPKTHHRNHQRAASAFLEAPNDELPQLVNIELAGIDHDIGEFTDRGHQLPLLPKLVAQRSITAERMRTARFAVTPQKRLV